MTVKGWQQCNAISFCDLLEYHTYRVTPAQSGNLMRMVQTEFPYMLPGHCPTPWQTYMRSLNQSTWLGI